MSLGMLINGKWTKEWTEHDEQGNFIRMETKFREAELQFQASDRGRYTIYASYGCPWAHRVIMAHRLLGLEEIINLVIVEPHISEDGWYFSDRYPDENYGFAYLRELYLKSDVNYTGRVTVPVLWDKEKKTIVNNESIEILHILNTQFKLFSKNPGADLFPTEYLHQIERTIEDNYHKLNNACYKTGFSKSQEVYLQEVVTLFENLRNLDEYLSTHEYLVGNTFTAADLCLLPTLLRFDVAYYSIFKCNLQRLCDFENIDTYIRRLLMNSKLKETFKPDHIKNLYYTVTDLNPSGIVPLGPKSIYE